MRLRDNCHGPEGLPVARMRRSLSAAACALALASLHAQSPPESVEARFQNAQQALSEHRYAAAAKAFEALLAADPQLSGAHANLGVARYLQGHYEQAAAAFQRALELSPSMPNVELYMGLSQARAGRTEEAFPALAKGFWNASDDDWRLQAGMILAELHAARREDDKVLDVVRALKKAFPSNPDVLYAAYRLHSDMGALALADLVREAPGSARLHQVTAELLVSEGDYPRAVRQYREALKVAPRQGGLHRALAVAIMNSNPDEDGIREAEQALERELALNPRDAESLYQLGEIAWRRGDEESAARHYEKAVESQPAFVEGLVGLAKALIARGEFARAAERLESAVGIDPEHEVARYRLAQAYRQLGRSEEAAKELEEFRRIRSASEALSTIYRQVQRSTSASDSNPTATSR